jgi:hypothetical protein
VNLTREKYDNLCSLRRRAFQEVAKALGKGHPITELMGSLAWGRHWHERGAHNHNNLRAAAEEFGALEGYAAILRNWARINSDHGAANLLSDKLPTGYNGI